VVVPTVGAGAEAETEAVVAATAAAGLVGRGIYRWAENKGSLKSVVMVVVLGVEDEDVREWVRAAPGRRDGGGGGGLLALDETESVCWLSKEFLLEASSGLGGRDARLELERLMLDLDERWLRRRESGGAGGILRGKAGDFASLSLVSLECENSD
jgi:hypothetical protein